MVGPVMILILIFCARVQVDNIIGMVHRDELLMDEAKNV